MSSNFRSCMPLTFPSLPLRPARKHVLLLEAGVRFPLLCLCATSIVKHLESLRSPQQPLNYGLVDVAVSAMPLVLQSYVREVSFGMVLNFVLFELVSGFEGELLCSLHILPWAASQVIEPSLAVLARKFNCEKMAPASECCAAFRPFSSGFCMKLPLPKFHRNCKKLRQRITGSPLHV